LRGEEGGRARTRSGKFLKKNKKEARKTCE
jgi:hypothetical protein